MTHQLTPKMLGEAIGVSESSLKRWSDEGLIKVTRTAGGHRRIDRCEAVRFIRDGGHTVVRPDILGLTDVPTPDVSLKYVTDYQAALTNALITGQAQRSRGIVLARYLAGDSLAMIVDEMILPSMRRVGELWLHNDVGIAIEHRATDICVQALCQLRVLLPASPPGGPVAIGAAPPGDPHLLPSMAAAAVLAAGGWQEMNLGPDTPWTALAGAARLRKASLVWLSFSGSQPPRQIARQLEWLGRELESCDARIVVGGRALNQCGIDLPDRVAYLSSMAELAAYAQGLRDRE